MWVTTVVEGRRIKEKIRRKIEEGKLEMQRPCN